MVAVSALANRQGDALVKQIKALKAPAWVESKAVDPGYEEAWVRQYNAYVKEKNALIWRLYLADPKNPSTADYMYERWNQFDDLPSKDSDVGPFVKRLRADIRRVLTAKPTPAIREAAKAAQVNCELMSIFAEPSQEAAAIEELQAYAKAYPKSKRLQDLMLPACQSVSESGKLAMARKYIAKYPGDPYAKSLSGVIFRADSMGKPFELKFTDAISGRPWDIAANRGKVVLIDFWATWCGPCRDKLPELLELYERYHSKGLEIIGISLDDSEAKGGLAKLKDFVAKRGLTWPQYHQGSGWESEFSSRWGVDGIPMTFLIDKRGNLRAVNERRLADRIEKLLSEE